MGVLDQGASANAESWRAVNGFPAYKVSSYGRVKNVTNGRVMVGEIDSDGYRRVNLSRQGAVFKRRVHRLVCEAFHGLAPEGAETRHLDGNRKNNRAVNLAWGTKSENMQDALAHGTFNRDVSAATTASAAVDRRGSKNPNAKLTDGQARQMRLMAIEGYSERVIARTFGCSPATAHRVICGERHVS